MTGHVSGNQMEFWLEPQDGALASHTVLRIQQYLDKIAVTLQTSQNPPIQTTITPLWEVALNDIDCTALQNLLCESLTYIGHIDAVAYDCTNSIVDDYWYATVSMCQSIGQTTMKTSLSVVLGLNPLDSAAAAVEASVRHCAVHNARSGIRVNIIYGPANNCITTLPVAQYLLHPHSRYLTGSVFSADGKILLGGMLHAERILAQRATPSITP